MFDHPWPADLPRHCPNCGKTFTSGVNLTIGPGKTSRILRAVAFGMVIPCMVVAVIVIGFLQLPNGGLSGGYALIGCMFAPPALVALAALLSPSSSRVVCSCGWKKDYPPPSRVR